LDCLSLVSFLSLLVARPHCLPGVFIP
jgi:hypothetical protein